MKQNYLPSRVFTAGDSTTVPDAFHTISIDPFISVQLKNHFHMESSESIFCAFLIKCRHKHVEVINSHMSHISSTLNILFQPLSLVSCWKISTSNAAFLRTFRDHIVYQCPVHFLRSMKTDDTHYKIKRTYKYPYMLSLI